MKRNLPSLNALRAFEAAARLGRMTLAAEELNVSHSAISRQVQVLEERLGVSLFEGTKNRPALTEAGRELLSSLTMAFDQIDAGIRKVADRPDGVLNVSCPGTFMMRWLIPRLYEFRSCNPEIDIRLSASTAPVDFARGGVDVAIRVGTVAMFDEAQALELFPERTGLVHSPDLEIDLNAGAISVPILHTLTRRDAWVNWQVRTGVELASDRLIEYEHYYFMLEAVCSGMGVCVAPYPYVLEALENGRLVAPYSFVDSGRSYIAISRRRGDAKTRLFLDWISRQSAAFQPT
ncbi:MULTISPECIES: LysR substrate-binding domain-containing protein [Rhizobium/Agrobacterium group]|uniref:LysR substrate-binding domain-containing protein n=1 Tax=Rhizobium/Agrobacterium group TaxID=227290 RepID=UPI002301002A|nr:MULTISPECIES: LysR substrate-binding domain-containing protein [Rhizobium/Agrobacterium group]MDA5635930.1 LysR substrate-binding domain-containing protein [Agrobacterium sp. ST15.16.024]MDF1891161.1 LysR substrate-binding domain-containing protein [Rhizobium rhizogenes]